MPWIFHQSNGAIFHNSEYRERGYAGHGEGKNNPGKQAVHEVGPIPQGQWRMTAWHDRYPGLGLWVIELSPVDGTETFGRSGFFWHGDNARHPGESSHGCIVSGAIVRREAWETGDHDLIVVF